MNCKTKNRNIINLSDCNAIILNYLTISEFENIRKTCIYYSKYITHHSKYFARNILKNYNYTLHIYDTCISIQIINKIECETYCYSFLPHIINNGNNWHKLICTIQSS